MADLTPELLAQLEQDAAWLSPDANQYRLGIEGEETIDGDEEDADEMTIYGILDDGASHEIANFHVDDMAPRAVRLFAALPALVAAAKERDQLRATLQMVEPERDALRAELDRRDVSYAELGQLRAEAAKHDEQIAAISDWLVLGAAARDEREALAAHVRALLQVIDRKSYSSAAQQEAVRAAEAAIGGVP